MIVSLIKKNSICLYGSIYFSNNSKNHFHDDMWLQKYVIMLQDEYIGDSPIKNARKHEYNQYTLKIYDTKANLKYKIKLSHLHYTICFVRI